MKVVVAANVLNWLWKRRGWNGASNEIFRANINPKVFDRFYTKVCNVRIITLYAFRSTFTCTLHVGPLIDLFVPFLRRVRNTGRNIESHRWRDYYNPAPVSLGGGDFQQGRISLRRHFNQQQICAHSRTLRQMVSYLFLLTPTTKARIIK